MKTRLSQQYGLVREPSEGTLYLMRPAKNRPEWAESIGVKLDNGWVGMKEPRYMVLLSDIEHLEESRLIKILEEIKKSGEMI